MNTLTLSEFNKLETISDIRTALFGDDTYTETTESTGDERGQLREVTDTRNLLTDEIVEMQTVEWSYFPTGEVENIVTRVLDTNNKELAKQTVSHFTDGRNPVLTVQKERSQVAEAIG